MGDEIPPSTTPIDTPHCNDVLCGRGGVINEHTGNQLFRKLVKERKREYLTFLWRREKAAFAGGIVSEIRSLEPPGRFLAKDAASGKWFEIGDKKAYQKTGQSLRENGPKVRSEIYQEALAAEQMHQMHHQQQVRLNAARIAQRKRKKAVPHWKKYCYPDLGYGPPSKPDPPEHYHQPCEPVKYCTNGEQLQHIYANDNNNKKEWYR